MDAIAHSPVPQPIHTDVAEKCPICLEEFHGRDVLPTVLKTRCGHCFDLECISQDFVSQPLGTRRCAYCRQDPMPLVNENTDKFYPDEFFPDQFFFDACSNGDLAFVSSRLLKGGSVNGAMDNNNNGFTALMLAAQNGQLEVVKLLLDKGAEVSAVNKHGFTALMLAARNGQLEVVKLLIDTGAKVSAVNKDGCTARMLAAHNGHADIINFLIGREAGDNTNPETNLRLARRCR